ncbi:hypothetical protein Hdeb2414_s0014g00426571 [Helianthus debilis subsp. tardiflorus]
MNKYHKHGGSFTILTAHLFIFILCAKTQKKHTHTQAPSPLSLYERSGNRSNTNRRQVRLSANHNAPTTLLLPVTTFPSPICLSSSKQPATTNRWWRTTELMQKREREKVEKTRREEKKSEEVGGGAATVAAMTEPMTGILR